MKKNNYFIEFNAFSHTIDRILLYTKRTSNSDEGLTVQRTKETENLLVNLKEIATAGLCLATKMILYGVIWEGDSGRPMCGVLETIRSDGVRHGGLGGYNNIDNVSFDIIRREIIRHYERGGMITIIGTVTTYRWRFMDVTLTMWYNPCYMEKKHLIFMEWLDRAAAFNSSPWI